MWDLGFAKDAVGFIDERSSWSSLHRFAAFFRAFSSLLALRFPEIIFLGNSHAIPWSLCKVSGLLQ